MAKPKSKFKKVKWHFEREIKIPEEWVLQKFDEVVKTNPPTKIKQNIVPYIPMDAVDTEKPSFNYFEERRLSKSSSLPKFQNNDVLFARITPSTENGKTSIVEHFGLNGVASSELTVLRASKMVLPRYLYYYVKSYRIRQFAISQMMGTTGRQRVPNSVFKKVLNFELPPLSEQQKIVSILSGVDALIESTQKVIGKTERLKKGLMQKLLTEGIGHTKFKKAKVLFGKHKEIPEEWEVTEFRKISVVKRGASPRPINDPKYFGQGRGWIRIQDISKSNKYLMQTKDYLSEVGEMKSIAVDKGDIIMSIAATVGKTIIVKMNACIHDGFIVFSNLSSKMNNEFLYYLLTNIENEFKNTGQHGTQSNINSELVSKTNFFKPPLLEQQKIASILSSADAYIQKNQEYKKKIELLKKGLMQKLLTGQIRVKVDH